MTPVAHASEPIERKHNTGGGWECIMGAVPQTSRVKELIGKEAAMRRQDQGA